MVAGRQAARPHPPARGVRQRLLRRPQAQPPVHGREPVALRRVYRHAGRRTGLAVLPSTSFRALALRGPAMTARNDERIDSLKFVTNPQPAANRSGKSWARLNPAFMARSAPSFQEKGEACVPMPISKYFTVVGSALLVLLFISNAYLTDDEAICGSTDRCTAARFMRLAWRRPGRRRNFALPAMSRPPFASGKYSPCSSPMSDGATSAIHNTGCAR